ncbi:MAG: xanthine phosphoribosyltransferase [Bacilli bacterium]|nr:xanthine phosphoribosyltransferase [Bacilli bacterium]
MKTIEEKILHDGVVLNNEIIKVDNFLNHQVDIHVLREYAQEVKEFFSGQRIDKVLTIETSGIAVAYAIAEVLGDVPFVFAKKSKSMTVGSDVYTSSVRSFTRNLVSDVTVSTRFLKEGENVLIVDDFLAAGNAALGLIDICRQAKANVVGFTAVIEKLFQGGRKQIEEAGVTVYAGASIKAFVDNKPVFD